jgi:hypothetical protein
MKKILLILLFCFANVFYAQEQKALFGIIRDSLDVINSAHIINLNSKQGTITAEDGTFKIFVKIGDTIAISSIQHQKKKYKITANSFSFQGLQLYLLPRIYQLKEVNLKRHDLAGSLGIDVNAVPITNIPDINAVTLGLPNAGRKLLSKVEREIFAASDGPLMLISSLLTGKLRMLKKKKKIQKEEKDVQLIYENIKYFLMKDLNIKKEDGYRFLYFCRTDSLFNNQVLKDELTLIKFLQKKAIEFNQL